MGEERMKLKERLVTLSVSLTVALLMGLAWVAPAFADSDGDAGGGVETLVPLVIVAVVALSAYLYWRSRRSRAGQS